jgi:intergrase/recombinase
MLRPGFEPGIVALRGQINDNSPFINEKQIDYDRFAQYLVSIGLNQITMKTRMAYARRYYHLLVTGDFSEIMEFSNDKKKHIMKSLALLSKYLGCYYKWQDYKNRYQLKWTVSRDALISFQAITNQDKIFSNMIEWIRNAISNYPRFKNIFMFDVLTGLRPAEAIESFNMLRDPVQRAEYLSKDEKILEHFRYPSIFLRRTKKAFISLVNEDILNYIENSPTDNLNYDKIRLTFERNHQKFYMSYCRKIFATFLRNEGVESELIDLLQGRISSSVFVRHYYRPDSSKFDEVREKLTKLHDLLLS